MRRRRGLISCIGGSCLLRVGRTTRSLSRRETRSAILSPAPAILHLYAEFNRHFGSSSDRLGLEDARAYQLNLITQQRSWSHTNQTVCALRIFYGVTLHGASA